MNDQTYDVVVAGAGPVGLFLAGELALAGCTVLVLERAEAPESALKRMPFGVRGLSASSIEAFDRRGLLDQLEIHNRVKNPHAQAGMVARRQAGHFAGITFYEEDIDRARWSNRTPRATPTNLISDLAEVESVLTRRVTELGVEIRRGHPVDHAEQDADGVTILAGGASIRGLWLVGCDGGRSTVRKSLGFEFAGTEPEFTGYSTSVDLVDPSLLTFGRVQTATGMYLQSQPGYIVIQDFDGGAFHDAKQPITREHVQDVLRRVSVTDVHIKKLHLASTWTDRARQATEYRRGRVLLAGDAAHIHSPLGGQGLNLGLGDAMNLGWKLAATARGRATDGLLDSYETERRPIGARVLDWSRAQVALMRPEPGARALGAIVRDLMATVDGATYFADRVWGVSTAYDLGDTHPLVGRSAQNLTFADGRTLNQILRDGRAKLINFGPAVPNLGIISDRLDYLTDVVDALPSVNGVLVRPDGVVSWVTTDPLDHDTIERAIATHL